MLTKSWRRLRSPAAWALAIMFGAPMLAEAQQSGLFPLAPIRRQRTPCPMENPVYGLYRHEYFGYHPTCWRRFPAGWGCPSPEAPDAAASFAKRPRDPAVPLAPTDDFEEPGPGPDGGGMEEGEPGAMPAVPRDNPLPPLPDDDIRTPFQTDPKPDAAPAPRPAPEPAPPGLDSSPFDLKPSTPAPSGDATSAAPPAAAAPAEGAATSAALPPAVEAPKPAIMPGPAAEAPALALPNPVEGPSAYNDAGSVPAGRPVYGQRGMKDAKTYGSGVVRTSAPAQAQAQARNQTPAKAPRRTSLLGSFFNRARR